MVEQIKEKIMEMLDQHGKHIPKSPDYDICVVLKDLYFYIEELEGKEYDINKDLHFLDKYKDYYLNN